MLGRALAAGAVLAIVGCGGGHDDHGSAGSGDANGDRTVDVEMVDVAFNPTMVTGRAGEKVTFRFTNKGNLVHDAFIGDAAAQAEHEREMTEQAGDHHHGGDTAVTVDPGGTGTLTYTFDKAGTIEIGCHEPGHYAAGMKMAVNVT